MRLILSILLIKSSFALGQVLTPLDIKSIQYVANSGSSTTLDYLVFTLSKSNLKFTNKTDSINIKQGAVVFDKYFFSDGATQRLIVTTYYDDDDNGDYIEKSSGIIYEIYDDRIYKEFIDLLSAYGLELKSSTINYFGEPFWTWGYNFNKNIKADVTLKYGTMIGITKKQNIYTIEFL
jgi:hypothetical protein